MSPTGGELGPHPTCGDFRSLPLAAWASIHEQFVVSDECDEVSLGVATSTPTAFTITLDRSDGSSVGLDLTCEAGDGPWIIDSVNGGLAGCWNEANPSKQVRPGDLILEVNGQTVSEFRDLVFACRKQVLAFTLLRRELCDESGSCSPRSSDRKAKPIATLAGDIQANASLVDAVRGKLTSKAHASGGEPRSECTSLAQLGETLRERLGLHALAISPSTSPTNLSSVNWSWSPDFSVINAAVEESPFFLSETYREAKEHDGARGSARKAFSTFRNVKKWKILSGVPGNPTRKQVHGGMRVVKSNAKKMASKTLSGLAKIRTVRSRISSAVKGFRSTGSWIRQGYVPNASHDAAFDENEFDIAGLHKKSSLATGSPSYMADIMEYVKENTQNAQVPEKAQKRIDYVKEKAKEKVIEASTLLSERVSQTAQKGLRTARNFVKYGGA
jgi:hypothetical protein